jgi:hypothetical protein
VFATMHKGGATLAVALLFAQGLPPKRAAEFQSRFGRESDPIHKAKMMPTLGDAEFEEIGSDLAAGNLSGAIATLKEYRDEAEICEKGLDAKGVDAEKHPAGFKQLQFSLREALRRLDDIIVGLPVDEQEPFVEARADLDQMNRHVIQELFPRRPAAKPAKPKD